MAEEKKSWGGRRPGSGRHKINKEKTSQSFSLRLPKELADVVNKYENKTEFFKSCILKSVDPKLEALGDIYPANRLKSVHVSFFDIGIVAGFPIPLDNDERAQDINLLKMLCPNPDSSYLIRVQGNSMIDAGINSGDIVIVDKSNRIPKENDIAVCEFNGEYTLKHFKKKDGCGWLVPDNPDFPEIQVMPYDDFRIWGIVTYIIHKPK